MWSCRIIILLILLNVISVPLVCITIAAFNIQMILLGIVFFILLKMILSKSFVYCFQPLTSFQKNRVFTVLLKPMESTT